MAVTGASGQIANHLLFMVSDLHCPAANCGALRAAFLRHLLLHVFNCYHECPGVLHANTAVNTASGWLVLLPWARCTQHKGVPLPGHIVPTKVWLTLSSCMCSVRCVIFVPAQLASGEVFGKNQPIALQLLGSQRSREALEGVAMELEDSLYPLLREVRGEGGQGKRGWGGQGGRRKEEGVELQCSSCTTHRSL